MTHNLLHTHSVSGALPIYHEGAEGLGCVGGVELVVRASVIISYFIAIVSDHLFMSSRIST